jgi:hypothetical protein
MTHLIQRTGVSRWWFGLGIGLIGAAAAWGQDRTSPYLVSVMPPSQSVAVSPTQVVSFIFSEPMNPLPAAQDLRMVAAFPPAGPLAFDSRWSGDRRILHCHPLPAWPPGTTVLWNVGTNFLDSAGNPLATHVVGAFITAHANSTGPGTGTNRSTEFRVTRWDRHRQTDADGPVLDTPWAAQFEAVTILASNLNPSAVSLITPTLTDLPLVRDEDALERFNLVEFSGNPNELAARYTGGYYQFRSTSEPGLIDAAVFFPLSQPPAPAVSDWASTRGMDPDEPWTLTWQPWPGADGDDHIEVVVGDGLLRSPAPGEPGALSGSATEWIVPAGTLAPRSTYEVMIHFSTVLSTSDPARFERTSARRATTTTFEIQTAPLPGGRLALSSPVWLGQQLEVELSGPPDTVVILQTNQAIAGEGWGVIMATNTGAGWVTLRLPWDPEASVRLFRAQQLLE